METIRKKLKISQRTLEEFLEFKSRNELKKQIALEMYEKRYFQHEICRKLSIKNNVLESWIKENQKNLKNVYGFPKQNGYGDVNTCVVNKKVKTSVIKKNPILYVNLEDSSKNFNKLYRQ